MKKYLKSYLILFSLILGLTIIYSLVSYYANSIYKTVPTLIPIISIITSSIYLGKHTKEKAYLEGLKFSSIYLILSLILLLIFKTSFTLKTIVYYLSILISSIIGSTLGINLKKKDI